MTFDIAPFERGTLVYPQPVAIACDRIRRGKTPQERLDALLKGAEVVTRYLAAISLSSFCARPDATVGPPEKLSSFNGPLSFGNFLNAIRNTYDECDHPLRQVLREAFHGRIKQVLQADHCLNELLDLRNELGHNLMSITEARAIAVLEEQTPGATLVQVLQRLEPILSLPLFLVDDQQIVAGKIVAQRLLLMGASADPAPEPLELATPLVQRRHPYLGFADGVLDLAPYLIWDVVPKKGNFGLYFIHEMAATNVVYQSVSDDEREAGATAREEVQRRLKAGELVAHERVAPTGRSSFAEEWHDRRTALEQSSVGPVPWNDFDPATIRWYGQRLGAKSNDEAARRVIRDQLLDGREYLRGEEIRQVALLFGRKELIQRQIGRSIVDLRAVKDPQKRWDERIETTTNVIDSLRQAVEFFGRHIAATGGVTIEGLTATSGSADYIAMREALVNLFIHQDYTDTGTAGQIEITPDRTHLFNAGHALVSDAALAEGGRSQPRNPLISRALKLIGFAELAGSGLRQVRHTWIAAARRPPVVVSDAARNTFALTLDWRPMPVVTDEFWHKRIGIKMSRQHAAIVLLSAEPGGVMIETIAAAQDVPLDIARKMAQWLAVNQMVVVRQDGRIILHESRRDLIEEAKAHSSSTQS